MVDINDRKQYILEWRSIFNELEISKYPVLGVYTKNLFDELQYYEEDLKKENIWRTFPKMIGIDSKLNILQSLIKVDETFLLKETQILEIVEKDYVSYTKEAFGFKLNETPHYSLLFNVK